MNRAYKTIFAKQLARFLVSRASPISYIIIDDTIIVSKVPQRRLVSEMKAIGAAERNGAGKFKADP